MKNTKEISDLRIKFNKHFNEQVRPMLNKFEKQRKSYLLLTFAIFGVMIGIICYFFDLIKTNSTLIWMFTSMLVVVGGCNTLPSKLEKDVKNSIMRLLMKAFGDFHWTQQAQLSEYEMAESLLFESFNNESYDDNFYGSYRGMNIAISEIELIRKTGKNCYTVFDGLVIQLDMNKKFASHTIVLQNGLIKKNIMNLEQVKLEDPQFEKLFDVYSTDQVESRYLLTTAFMERFKDLIQVFKTKNIQCSFKNQKILIAIDVRRDLFKLGGLLRNVEDTKQYEELFNQISAIFEMINVLKLDNKIGL